MEPSKVLLINLAVLVSCFLTASSLKCYDCKGTNTKPDCNATEECSSPTETQCISSVEKDGDTITYEQRCAAPLACSTAKVSCELKKRLKTLDECAYECCSDKDLCNKDFPSLSSGIQVTSGLVAIATTLVFALFIM